MREIYFTSIPSFRLAICPSFDDQMATWETGEHAYHEGFLQLLFDDIVGDESQLPTTIPNKITLRKASGKEVVLHKLTENIYNQVFRRTPNEPSFADFRQKHLGTDNV